MYAYYIVEMQSSEDGGTIYLVETAKDINVADQIYHTKLSYAAVSAVYLHAVVMLRNDGTFIKHQSYIHPTVEEKQES